MKKNFNKTNHYYTNQQLIRCEDLFRGVVAKEWVIGNQGRINFYQHDKLLAQNCVQHYHECWKLRCAVMHNLEAQIKLLKDEVLNILEETSKEEVEWKKDISKCTR